MRYITTTIATVLFGFVGLATWLVWPLPEAKFDWQSHAASLVQENQCGLFGTFVLQMAFVDPETVQAYVAEQSLLERCPRLDDRAFPLEGTRSDFMTREIASAVGLSIDLPQHNPNDWRAVREAFSFWHDGREARQQGFLPALAWPDLVMGFRCVRPLDFAGQSDWYNARQNSGYVFSGPNPLLIDAWERRLEGCSALASTEATNLRTHMGADTKVANARAVSRRISNYETMANRWRATDNSAIPNPLLGGAPADQPD